MIWWQKSVNTCRDDPFFGLNQMIAVNIGLMQSPAKAL